MIRKLYCYNFPINLPKLSKGLFQSKFSYMLVLMIVPAISIFADPWGKDSDLSHRPQQQRCERMCPTPVIGPIAEMLIRFHQEVISPADGPRSHFLPSSSQYTLQAMNKYGFIKGYLLGCDRLMRENAEPWVYRTGPDLNGKIMKLDPVR